MGMRSLVLLSLVAAVGCQSAALSDNTDLKLFASAAENSLSSPYVLGAEFELEVVSAGQRPDGWTLESSNPDVLTVDAMEPLDDASTDGDTTIGFFPAHARSAGTTVLTLRDADGKERGGDEVEVKRPDRFEVRAAIDVEVDEDNAPLLTDPSVVIDGEAAFEVTFFAGDAELAGAGGMTAVAAGDAEAVGDNSTFPDDTDYLVLAPHTAGPDSVALGSGGVEVGVFNFEAVESGVVTTIELDAESEVGAENGDGLNVHALARDAAGESVYGASFSWSADGQRIEEVGDRVSYDFAADTSTKLEAAYGGGSAAVTIHGTVTDVGSSNDVSCAVANVGPIASAIALAMAGAAGRRRRGPR